MTKRKGLLFTLFLIVFLFCTSLVSGAASQYDMSVTYGIGNTAKPGKSLRIQADVTGDFEEGFAGVIRIAPTSDYSENVRFDFPVTAESAGVISSDVYIPLVPDSKSMRVSLLNEKKDQEYASIWVDFNYYDGEKECLTGILSENPLDLDFLQDASMRYGSLRLKEVAVGKGDIPDDVKGYDIFDLIIVSDYSLEGLSEAQFTALSKYVENGGILLLDGNNPERNFGKFYDELIESPSDISADIVISNFADPLAAKPGDEELVVSATDLNIRDGITIVQGDRFPAIYYVKKGQGRIVITTFAIPEINYYCEKDSSFAETFLTYVLGEEKIEELSSEDSFGYSEFYYNIRNLIGTGSLRRLPSMALLGTVIMVYVILIGPVLHGILKSFGYERYYLGSAVTFALICTGLIYVIGSGTRFTDTFYTYARIVNLSDNVWDEDTYVNVRSPFDEKYDVVFDGDYEISPIPVRDIYEDRRRSNRDKNTITRFPDRLELELFPSETFESQIFRLQKKWGVSDEGVIVEASYKETEEGIIVSGKAESHMSKKLENAVLMMNGKAVIVGNMEPGQEILLDEQEQFNFPLGDVSATARKITGNTDTGEAVRTGNSAGLLAQDRRRLLNFYFTSMQQKEYDKPVFIGFVSEKEEEIPEFFVNAKSVQGITIATTEAVKMDSGKQIYPIVDSSIKVVSGSYDTYANTMLNDIGEPLVMEYDLGEVSTLKKIKFEYMSECFEEDKDLLTPEFTGEILFFNHETGAFTRMEDKEEYSVEELKDYLSPSCGLLVRYNSDFNRDISWEMALPRIYVINNEQ